MDEPSGQGQSGSAFAMDAMVKTSSPTAVMLAYSWRTQDATGKRTRQISNRINWNWTTVNKKKCCGGAAAAPPGTSRWRRIIRRTGVDHRGSDLGVVGG
ncbi:Hypothetical protein NTJ_02652 [Nesidiocoris tenuis]|uniref:Uncharacterized protein n=1 Tax=Nesidiocoris tenuis TaxID=355587 RepID=A0ABN7AC20_9HEMI|nr:Hypothetical protein NTJ_02652 [Nesidiocoris tenuis]